MPTNYLEFEDGSGVLLLEHGAGRLEIERYIREGTFYPVTQEPIDTTTGIDFRIFRANDGFWWDFDDDTFKNAGWTTKEQALTEDDDGLWSWGTGWGIPDAEATYKIQFEVTDGSGTHVIEGPTMLVGLSSAQTFLPIFQDTAAVVATAVGCGLARTSDGFWLDWNDGTFKNAGWTTKQLVLTADDDGIWYDSTGWAIPASDEHYKIQWKVTDAEITYYVEGPLVIFWGGASLNVDALLPYLEIEATCTHLTVDATLPALTVETAYNRFVTATAQVSGYLPGLRCEGQFGERATLDERLPGLELAEMRAGSRLDAKLPDLECEATMLIGHVLTLDEKLPTMGIEADFGARADDLKLPTFEIDISIIGDRLLRLDKILPGLEIEAAGSTPVLMTLDKKLPALRPAITISFDTTGAVDGTIPPFKIDASMLYGQVLTLDEVLPMLSIVATGYCGDMELDASLPALVMGPWATGTISGGGPSILTEASRFEDYVLRHER